LCSLRLVNKAFSAAATAIFLQQNCITWPCLATQSDDTFSEGMVVDNTVTDTLASLPAMGTSTLVKNLKVDFLADQNVHFYQFTTDSNNRQKYHTLGLLRDFPQLLSNVTNLEFLSFGIGRWKNISTDDYRLTYLLFDTDQFTHYQNSLRSGSFDHLTALKLHLPSTYTFNLAFDDLGPEVLGRLKHPFLEITDKTGEGGSKATDGDYDAPMSNYLQQYHVKEHAGDFFRWISMCTKLESLSITGAQPLDSAELQWKPDGNRLKLLDLHRIRITDTTLTSLMSNSAGVPSSLAKTSLIGVELMAGTWDKIFEYMDGLSALAYLCPLDLGYAEKGRSSHLRRTGHTVQYLPLWTRHNLDEPELLRLFQKLNGLAAAAGLKYPVGRGENGIAIGFGELQHAFKKIIPPYIEELA
jgi:hypothetical protein